MRLAFKRRSLLLLTLAVALAIAGVSSAVGQGDRATRAPSPSLVLTNRSPVTVGGRHFRASPRVKVTLILTRRWTQTVTLRAGGAFSVSFPATIDRCGPWSVTAVQGDRRVLLRSGAKPLCAPAGPP